jgi:hypothetical protein
MQNLKFFLMKLFISLKHFFGLINEESQLIFKTTFEVINVVKTWEKSHEELIKFVEGMIPGSIPKIVIDDVLKVLSLMPKDYKVFTGDERKLFLHNLYLKVALVFAGGKIHFGQIVQLLQWYFDNHQTTVPPINLLTDINHNV